MFLEQENILVYDYYVIEDEIYIALLNDLLAFFFIVNNYKKNYFYWPLAMMKFYVG